MRTSDKAPVASTTPKYYTRREMDSEKRSCSGKATRKTWSATKVQHLMRHESGIYYVRLKKMGNQIWRSLRTTSLEIARRRLSEVLSQQEKLAGVPKGKETQKRVGEVAELILKGVSLDPSRKRRTKRYWVEVIESLWTTWPDLKETDAKRITSDECLSWASRHAAKYSATRYNGTVAALKRVFQTAIKLGLRADNPAAELKRLKPKTKDLSLRLPSVEKFKAWVLTMRTCGRRFSVESADTVEFLAYSGLRITEARNVRWADWDKPRNQLVIHGDPLDGTKNSEIRRIELIPAMRTLMERLHSQRKDEKPSSFVLTVRDARHSMGLAAEALGIPDLTHHDLRHLFATMCIEAGIDIPTVSKWLGHKDGGALAMRVYGHLRREHSAAAAARVTFGA